MAKYNRAFLVPYLQDVCAVELQINKLDREIRELQSKIDFIQKKNYYPRPYKEYYKKRKISWDDIGTGIFVTAAGMIGLLIACCIFGWIMSPWSLALILCPGPLVVAYHIWSVYTEKRDAEEQYEAEYRQRMALYNESLRAQELAKPKILALEDQRKQLENQFNEAIILRSNVYGVNVIPMQYRNKYTAVYLYQYFSTAQADDIDMILQTFVLEEIKAKLDEIIVLQTEAILKQEMIMANQRAALESQEQHQAYMEQKARQIAASNEEQSVYLGMIEANTSAAAYFSAANYLK